MEFSLEQYLNELKPLVNIDCGTSTISGVEVVADLLTDTYEDMGWDVTRMDLGDKVGPGICCRNKPDAEHYDLLLIGHMDTVFPPGTVAKRPMSVDEHRAYGPGVSDMKSGLLNIIWALRALDASVLNKLSIGILMNPDEETGSVHSHKWIESYAEKSRCVLVAEAARADGSLVKARKGMASYRLMVSGLAAHAGNEPEKGRSAITELAHWILALNQLSDFASGTTLNVGKIQGGAAANIVPDYAEAVIDVRYWDNERFKALDNKIRQMLETPFTADVQIKLEELAFKSAMATSRATEQLMLLIEESAREIDVKIGWQAVGGGADANVTAALGIPTIDGLGPVGAGFHSDKEYLELDSIAPRIKLLQRVIEKLAD